MLILVLLVGVNGSAARSPSTTTPPPNDDSSTSVFGMNVSLHGPLATNLRGVVGPADPIVIVPLDTTRPWLLHAPNVVATLVCGGHTTRVTSVVDAPSPTCQLNLAAAGVTPRPWTLQLLP